MQSNLPEPSQHADHIFSSKGTKTSIDQLIQEEPQTWKYWLVMKLEGWLKK